MEAKEVSAAVFEILEARGYSMKLGIGEVEYFVFNAWDKDAGNLTAVEWADRLGRLMNEDFEQCPRCGLSRAAGFGDEGCELCRFGEVSDG
jgi:hypothetical protein